MSSVVLMYDQRDFGHLGGEVSSTMASCEVTMVEITLNRWWRPQQRHRKRRRRVWEGGWWVLATAVKMKPIRSINSMTRCILLSGEPSGEGRLLPGVGILIQYTANNACGGGLPSLN